jgi:kynurenine formamidase
MHLLGFVMNHCYGRPNGGNTIGGRMSEEWRAVAEKIRNWGRWGPDDQLGTLNFITAAHQRRAAGLATQGKRFSLAIPLDADGPMGARGIRRNPVHILSVDGGDNNLQPEPAGVPIGQADEIRHMYSDSPFRFNDDWIVMPLQGSTQWDALSHVYYDDLLYNGFAASTVSSLGASKNGIEVVAAAGHVTGRGVLLDVARHRGLASLAAGDVISPEELDDVAAAQGVMIGPGDIVIVRTGWWSTYYPGHPTWGTRDPGVSWRVAEWLWERDVAAIAADCTAVEVLVSEGTATLPFHMLTLRDMGMMLGEIWNLEELADDCHSDHIYEFLLVAPPLKVTGGVGSPVNPVAMK